MTLVRTLLAIGLLLSPAAALAQLEDDLEPLVLPSSSKHRPASPPKKQKPRTAPPASAPPSQVTLKLPDLNGLRLFVDGEERPLDGKLEFPSGEHVFNVRKMGYADFVRKVKLPPGRTELPVHLDAVAGTVALKLIPPDAAVSVDGRQVQLGKDGVVLLPAGVHQLSAKRTGYVARSTKVSVEVGRDYVVELFLNAAVAASEEGDKGDRPQMRPLTPARSVEDFATPHRLPEVAAGASAQPWYGHWYVWAGAAAIVAGAVTTGILVANQNGGVVSPSSMFGGHAPDACMNNPSACK